MKHTIRKAESESEVFLTSKALLNVANMPRLSSGSERTTRNADRFLLTT